MLPLNSGDIPGSLTWQEFLLFWLAHVSGSGISLLQQLQGEQCTAVRHQCFQMPVAEKIVS